MQGSFEQATCLSSSRQNSERRGIRCWIGVFFGIRAKEHRFTSLRRQCFALPGTFYILGPLQVLRSRLPSWAHHGRVRRGLSAAEFLNKVLIAIPLVLSFFVLIGIRIGYAVAVDLDAHWLFLLAPIREIKTTIAGIRKFMICIAIIPVFAFLSVFYALIWDWRMILVHFCFGLSLSVVFMEVLLTDLQNPVHVFLPSSIGKRPSLLSGDGAGRHVFRRHDGPGAVALQRPRKFVYFYASHSLC